MKKIIIIGAIAGFIVAIAGYYIYSAVTEQSSAPVPAPVVAGKMTETEAKTIAEATCIKGGEALAGGYYNEGTKTWWFDANLNATRPGCSPACVVSEDTKQAEINWRCTGAILPTGPTMKTVTDEKQGITFSYPDFLYELPGGEFAPKVKISNAKFVCDVSNSGGTETTDQLINNKEYCVTTTGEGAAGSTYTTYTYGTSVGDKLESVAFVIRTTNCGVYGEGADYDHCVKDNASIDANAIGDQIISSIVFKR